MCLCCAYVCLCLGAPVPFPGIVSNPGLLRNRDAFFGIAQPYLNPSTCLLATYLSFPIQSIWIVWAFLYSHANLNVTGFPRSGYTAHRAEVGAGVVRWWFGGEAGVNFLMGKKHKENAWDVGEPVRSHLRH